MRSWMVTLSGMLLGCTNASSADTAGTSTTAGDWTSTRSTGSAGVFSTTATTMTTTAAESSGSSSTSTSTSCSGASSSSTTGSELQPSLSYARITDTNRAYVEMHGGWGPHLRAPMRAADGSLWFAYDEGPDVASNTTIHYARQAEDGTWSTVASQPHGAGVQQNAAHVLRGNTLFTYAVNPGAAVLEECYLDVTDPDTRACNTILIGGAYSTPPNSNYIGAALDPDGARVVWFTVVGAAGGTGQFVHTYNFGGGWNGPVATALPGYNDLAYVRASFSAPNVITWLRQAYIGAYPNGDYAIGAQEVALGEVPSFVTLGPPVQAGESVRTAGDVWVDPDTGDTHALARVDQDMHVYRRPVGETWAAHAEPVAVLPSVTRARFVTADGAPLVAVTSGAAGVVVRWVDLDGPIDWEAAPSVEVVVPSEGFDAPSAIYTAGPSTRAHPSKSFTSRCAVSMAPATTRSGTSTSSCEPVRQSPGRWSSEHHRGVSQPTRGA